ncbi:MAG: hypothetical protein H0X72_07515, partial [Acidobacteria bacterium]|nr:hypothetical protein [Acidobacteriota bacterium]
METLKRIQILRADRNQTVDAEIIRLITDVAREKIDKVWWKLPSVSAEEMNDEGDFHWDWERLARIYSGKILHECVAVLSQENYLEGAMVYQFNAKSKLEPNRESVYVGWLASAPRNRNWLVNQTFYKGVGTMLLDIIGNNIFLQSSLNQLFEVAGGRLLANCVTHTRFPSPHLK